MNKLLFAFALSICCDAATLPPEAEQRLAHDIYKEMIESKSGFSTGSTTPIAESVAARFKAAGFPAKDIYVGGAIPTKPGDDHSGERLGCSLSKQNRARGE